jgi:hypothetical protein
VPFEVVGNLFLTEQVNDIIFIAFKLLITRPFKEWVFHSSGHEPVVRPLSNDHHLYFFNCAAIASR